MPDDSMATPSEPLPSVEIEAARRRPDDADLVAEHLVARSTRHEQDALRAVAADDVGVLGLDATHCRVGRAEQDSLLGVAEPSQCDRVRRRQRDAGQRVDRVDQVFSDRVALDQIAHARRSRESRLPMPKPSMARPRMTLCDASRTRPVEPPV